MPKKINFTFWVVLFFAVFFSRNLLANNMTTQLNCKTPLFRQEVQTLLLKYTSGNMKESELINCQMDFSGKSALIKVHTYARSKDQVTKRILGARITKTLYNLAIENHFIFTLDFKTCNLDLKHESTDFHSEGVTSAFIRSGLEMSKPVLRDLLRRALIESIKKKEDKIFEKLGLGHC